MSTSKSRASIDSRIIDWDEEETKPDEPDQEVHGNIASLVSKRRRRSAWKRQKPQVQSGPPRKLYFDPKQTSIGRMMSSKPPVIRYLFEDVLSENILAMITGQGGIGKSFFLMQIAMSLATGKAIFDSLVPVRPRKVLYVGAEDSQDELHRRLLAIHRMAKFDSDELSDLRMNLHIASALGKAGPLIVADGHETHPTEYYEGLAATIEAHPGLEVVILDPKNRFSGVAENDNDLQAQWVACLEWLVREYGITILFAHHVSKASYKNQDQNASRGASALVDGVRWVGALTPAKKLPGDLGEEDERLFAEFTIVKSNYASTLKGPRFLKRGAEGVLKEVQPKRERIAKITDALVELLREAQENGENFSARDLGRRKNNSIVERLKESFQNPKLVLSRELPEALSIALDQSLLEEVDEGRKKVLRVLT